MPDATTAFFQALETRGHAPRLEKVTGTFRFDLTNGKRKERWLVTVNKGDLEVSHRNAKADCVIRSDKKVFEGIVAGKVNAFAAVLRGTLEIEGDAELLALFQRVLPAPRRRGS
jgi:putative sterol carrier protein